MVCQWVQVTKGGRQIATFDVHFVITGFMVVEAKDKEDACQIVNCIIDNRIEPIESILHTGLKDDEYVTEVVPRGG